MSQARSFARIFTVICPAAPAAFTVNGTLAEVPPPGAGFTTVTAAAPAVVRFEAGIWAVKLDPLTTLVVSGVPFQSTVDEAMKFDPLTLIATAGLPALADDGDIDVRLGAGFGDPVLDTVSEMLPEACPPADCGFSTVTAIVPADANCCVVSGACNDPEDT